MVRMNSDQTLKRYHVYMATMLTCVVLLLAALVGTLLYGSLRLRQVSVDTTSKIDNFNNQVNDMNKSLQKVQDINQGIQNVNNNIQQLDKDLKGSTSTISTYKLP